MPNARIVDIADAVVAFIAAKWQANIEVRPPIYPSEVVRAYDADIDLNAIQGRKVFVFVGPYKGGGPSSRGPVEEGYESEIDYTLSITVAERYAGEGAGDPINSPSARGWIDERVYFTESVVYDPVSGLGKPDGLQVDGHNLIWCESDEGVETYDPANLQAKVFVSRMEFLLREIR